MPTKKTVEKTMKRSKLYSYSNGKKFIGKSSKQIFTEIENENIWQESESVSGIGSTLVQTSKITDEIPKVINELNIETIFDVPCGDFNWFQKINLDSLTYLGGDIVSKIITKNIQKHKKKNINFISFNLLEEIPIKYDVIFCRDCLVHFSITDIYKALKNIKKSGSKYLMMTTFPEEENNSDITTGGWRPLNFEIEPFNFSKPIFMINEGCTEMDGAFNDKSLGVWITEDLQF